MASRWSVSELPDADGLCRAMVTLLDWRLPARTLELVMDGAYDAVGVRDRRRQLDRLVERAGLDEVEAAEPGLRSP